MSAENLFDLGGQVALVTGAGQGLGRAIAKMLADQGATVIVNDFHGDRAERVAAEIIGNGGRAAPLQADVTDLETLTSRLAGASTKLGPISILVNNAGNGGAEGFPPDLPLFWDSNPRQWRQFAEVNLFGVMNCCHAVLRAMVAAGKGRIVTITSDAARNLEPRQASYAAAKAGAAGFMRALAADTARFNITANSVAISTLEPAMPHDQLEAFLASDRSKRQLARYPLRRYGQAEDIVGTVLLLCSDAAGWTTGQTYPVNGGYSPSL